MEFTISKNEIVRRKKAFLALLTSVFIGVFFASSFFDYHINIITYSLIVATFFLFYWLTNQFFVSISKIKLYIDDKKLEKTNGKNVRAIKLSEISKIKVKRRTNGIIREIYIYSQDKESITLTALEEDFEDIFNILVNKSRAEISIKEIKEPFNFDHLLFYPILGLLIGFLSIGFFKIITNADILITKIILLIFSIYLFILSAYFFIKKPISTRGVENRNKIADYLIGIIMFCCGVFMILASLVYW